MLASIIIPVLNEEQRLASLIGYLRKLPDQKPHSLEVIVVDGGSTDASLEIATELADTVVQSAPGRAIQMNKGAQLAHGEVLVFLHADTRPTISLLSQCNQLIEASEVWCFSKVRLDDSAKAFRVIEWFMNIRSYATSIATGDQMICVEAATFHLLEGYANILLMEDVDLSKRLKRISRPLVLDARVVCSARKWLKNGVLKTVLMMWLLRAAYFFGVSPQRLQAIYYG